MPSRAQVTLTTGESGAGKSMLRCAVFLVNDFLPDETGIHYSNFPIRFEKLAEHLGWTEEKLRARVKILPEDELRKWRDGVSGPWEYFAKDTNFSGCHIAIDEAHRYVSSEHTRMHVAKWKEFCGGVRHQGGTIEFLTQNEAKLHRMVNLEAGEWINIVTPARRIEPFTGATWYDTLQVVSKLRKKAVGLSFEIRHSRDSGGKKWRREEVVAHWHDPKYWALYDSYNVIADEGRVDELGAELRRPKEPWERFSLPRLLVWYVARNTVPLGIRAVIIGLLIWAFLFNGIGYTVTTILNAGIGSSSTLSTQIDGPKRQGQGTASPGEPQPNMAEPYRSAVSPEELNYLRDNNQKLAARLMEVSAYVESLTTLTAVMVQDEKPTAFWADGTTSTVGSQVPTGPFKELWIREIDVRKGTVRLSDQTVLRVGVISAARLQQLRKHLTDDPAGTADPAAVLSRSGRPLGGNLQGGSGSPARPAGGSLHPARDPAFSGNAAPNVSEQPRRRTRNLDGGLNRSRSSDGVGGLHSGSPHNGSADDRPSSFGRPGGSEGSVLSGNEEKGGQGGLSSPGSKDE